MSIPKRETILLSAVSRPHRISHTKEPLAQQEKPDVPPLQIDDCGSGVLGAFCLGGGRTESPLRARPDGRAASPATNAKHTPPSPGRRVIKAVGGIVRGVGNLVSPRRKRQQ